MKNMFILQFLPHVKYSDDVFTHQLKRGGMKDLKTTIEPWNNEIHYYLPYKSHKKYFELKSLYMCVCLPSSAKNKIIVKENKLSHNKKIFSL